MDDSQRTEMLLKAAENDDVETAAKLLGANADLARATDEDGYSALHRACHGNRKRIIELLLAAGARVDARTNDGWQPLHCAARWSCADAASAVLRSGADVNATSNGGQTPLHLAASVKSTRSPVMHVLLLEPSLDAGLSNDSGDTAHDVARRTGPLCRLFEMAEPSLNEI